MLRVSFDAEPFRRDDANLGIFRTLTRRRLSLCKRHLTTIREFNVSADIRSTSFKNVFCTYWCARESAMEACHGIILLCALFAQNFGQYVELNHTFLNYARNPLSSTSRAQAANRLNFLPAPKTILGAFRTPTVGNVALTGYTSTTADLRR